MDKNSYIQAVRLDFLSALLRSWQKRNNRLLHVHVDNLVEPTFFWEMGFDVTALCLNQQEFEKCEESNGKKIEYVIGKAEHLPFDEKTFDYVVFTHGLTNLSKDEILHVLNEAHRVSTKNVCILEYCSYSFNPIKPALSPFLFKSLEKELKKSRTTSFYAALRLPSFLWSPKLALSTIQSYPLNFPFGTFMALETSHNSLMLTSLPLQVGSAASEIS